MKQEDRISVDYVARVEGQTGICVRISGGEVQEVQLDIFEPPKFFEAFLIGRRCDEVHELTSRICGICPVAHQVTALRAVENAMGTTVSQQTRDLRKLLALSALIQSHALNLYFLALPDYLGYESILPMTRSHLPVVERAFRLRQLGNDLTDLLGGRAVHPVTVLLNGFTKIPEKEELHTVRARLEDAKEDAAETVELVANLNIPSFERKCEQIALSHPSEYAINEGRIISTEGLNMGETEYRSCIREKEVPHSTSKHSFVVGRDSFLTGPLARVNINFDKLSSNAKMLAVKMGFKPLIFNPFSSHMARALELVHAIDESIEIIDRIPLKEEERSFEIRPGKGSAMTEAPRGILYHSYEVDEDGLVKAAEIVPPTAHNAYNIEKDIRHLVPKLMNLEREEVRLKCEMLVRAYDPCVSCSVHATKVRIEED